MTDTTRKARELDAGVRQVQAVIERTVCKTSLSDIIGRCKAEIGGGKMLRSRLILAVGPAAGVPDPVLYNAGAAVEMLHSASLLHDDVVDGGAERRGEPTFWVVEGIKAAVLVGDLLVSQAVGRIQEVLPKAVPVLVETMQEMCDAEVEQEFHLAAEADAWEQCVSIARRKTGSLFGFAGYCAAGGNPELSIALRRAGYAIGTAYQLADDLLDTAGADVAVMAGKTLGTDAQGSKLTAASSWRPGGQDPMTYLESLLRASGDELAAWPGVLDAWEQYAECVVAPVIRTFTRCAAVGEVS